VKTKKARYQQGSIRRVKRAKGYAWKVRSCEMKDGKMHQRTEVYDGAQYRTEKGIRKAIKLTVSQINSGTPGNGPTRSFLLSRRCTERIACQRSSTGRSFPRDTCTA
jgi:integrase